MQQLNDPAFAIDEEAETVDGVESDKEIVYLRKRTQGNIRMRMRR